MTGDLFDAAARARRGRKSGIPLAERMRPRAFDDLVGQKAVAPGSLLRSALQREHLPSLLLFGPPGAGKTTLARLVAEHSGLRFEAFSAVLSGVKEVREVVEEARHRRRVEGQGTILFVDEIHRFNRAQQDAFLPHVEDGTIVLIGATTENPSFHVNAALLSRCLVIPLEPLAEEALVQIAERALVDERDGLGTAGVRLTPAALRVVAKTSHGDARSLLNRLETLVEAAGSRADATAPVDVPDLEALLSVRPLAHDRDGELHFDLISALHKSIRGGDPQATLYWLARMLEGGEEPLYLLRRLVRIAVEDVGLADPKAMEICAAAVEAWRFLGSPEGDLAIAEAAVYLATAPKSNALYAAFGAVAEEVRGGAVHPVPLPLRNAPTKLMKQLGYGRGYLYPHDYDEAVVEQQYLPDALRGKEWYRPSPYGHEKEIARRLAWWAQVLRDRAGPTAKET